VSRAPFAVACAAVGGWILSRAWVADDAFISWRVIENLMSGYGLRWNPDERVQVFTHPLWALLHVPVYAATGSLVAASFWLAALCLALAGWFALRAAGGDRAVFLLAFLLPLAASRAFADHAVSGLETPLVAACTAAFAAQALGQRASGAKLPWLELALSASLLATARPDALLLVLPCLAALALRGGVRWTHLALGALPLLAWELFSLFYFGFAFPNTKYAKLDTGIAAGALARQGLFYALDLVRRDGASALILLLGLALSAREAWRARRSGDATRPLAFAALGLGVAALIAFVIAVGGDFMSGRFFAPAVFLAAVLIARALQQRPGSAAAVASLALLASLATSARPADPNALWRGISDERRIFEPFTSVLREPGFRDGAPQRHPWFVDGASARARARASGAPEVIVRGAVGMLGYAAGPEVIVIDEFALADPLLARLPVATPGRWRIGHFQRAIPDGYLRARASGDTREMQPDLARYWKEIRLVVSGPLLAPERLRAIARLNTGGDEKLREAYLRSLAGRRGG
jgi:arabinofuranosyltransferase